MELRGVRVVGVDADHREQALALGLTARRAQALEQARRLLRTLGGAEEVHQPVLDVRERSVRLREAEPVAGALELAPGLDGEPPRALGRALVVIHPGEHEQALAAPERLVHRREVLLAAARDLPRPVVVAEQVLDPRGDRLALGEAEHVAESREELVRLPDEPETFGRVTALARQVTEQPQAMPEVLLIAQALEALASELDALGRLFRPADVPQHLRAPPVLEGEAPPCEASLEELQIGERLGGLLRPVPGALQEVEEGLRGRVVLVRVEEIDDALADDSP